MKFNQVFNYALGLVGLGVVVYVAGRAWKASKTSTLGDQVTGAAESVAQEVKGAVSTGKVIGDVSRLPNDADVVLTGAPAEEESNFAGSRRDVLLTDSRGGWA